MKHAFWVNPRGKILDVSTGTHIDQVIQSPKSFNITDRYIKNVYTKYDEPVGLEGKAREELMLELIKSGFIRIRYVKNRFWIVNASKFTPKVKKALSVWAEDAKNIKGVGKYMPVKIVTDTETITKYDVNDLYYEKHILESEKLNNYHPIIVESIQDFKYNNYDKLQETIN